MIFSQVSLYFFRLLAFKDFLHFAQVIYWRPWLDWMTARMKICGGCAWPKIWSMCVWPRNEEACLTRSWCFTIETTILLARIRIWKLAIYLAQKHNTSEGCCDKFETYKLLLDKELTRKDGHRQKCLACVRNNCCAIWRPATFLVWTSYMVYGISWSFPLRRWSTFFETRGSHRSRWSVSIPSHAWWTGL